MSAGYSGFAKTLTGLVVPRVVLLQKAVEGGVGILAGFGLPEFVQVGLRFGLGAFRASGDDATAVMPQFIWRRCFRR